MSATTESLLGQIKITEEALARAEGDGSETIAATLRARLNELRRQFTASNEALNEGKQSLLKG